MGEAPAGGVVRRPFYDRRVTVPLWRNRDFVLLEAGRLLSSAGNQISFIAYPLLVLAETGSPAKAGLVSFARLLPSCSSACSPGSRPTATTGGS